MTPEDMLWWHQGAALRWLRDRLALTRPAFARWLGVSENRLRNYEADRQPLPVQQRVRLAAALAPRLATPEGEAFARSLGRGGE